MENYFGYVLFALGIVIMFLLHYKKGMKWKWSIILGYTAFAFMMTIFMGVMAMTMSTCTMSTRLLMPQSLPTLNIWFARLCGMLILRRHLLLVMAILR